MVKSKSNKLNIRDIVTWLNELKNPKKLEENHILQAMYFSFNWSAFEGNFLPRECKNIDCKLRSIAEGFANFIPQDCIDVSYKHFHKRFIDSADTKRFDNLDFINLNLKRWIYNNLKIENLSKEKKLATVLIIAYRYRNNLFHGKKDLFRLNNFEREFEVMNRLIMSVISSLIEQKTKIFKYLKETSDKDWMI